MFLDKFMCNIHLEKCVSEGADRREQITMARVDSNALPKAYSATTTMSTPAVGCSACRRGIYLIAIHYISAQIMYINLIFYHLTPYVPK